jgi:DNA repair exonuclease SbcCD ATPase subunit
VYTRVKAEAYKSRATRCSAVIDQLTSIVNDLEVLKNELDEMTFPDTQEETALTAQQKAWIIEIYEEVDSSVDTATSLSDIDGLVDEIESWKSGLEGTNFEGSDKYSTLESTLESLESAQSSLESLSFDPPEEGDDEPIDGATEEIDSVISEILEAISELENAEFPGMYG